MSVWVRGVSHDYRKRSRPGRKDYHTRRAVHSNEGRIIAIDGEGRPASKAIWELPWPLEQEMQRVQNRFNLSEIEDESRRAAVELDNIGTLKSIPERNRRTHGEWDWSKDLSTAERARLRRRWTSSDGIPVDVFAEMFRPNLPVDLAMEEWLFFTRLADAGPVARVGRELGRGFGGADLESLFTRARPWEPKSEEEYLEAGYVLKQHQDYFVMVASDATQKFQQSCSVGTGRLSTEQVFEFLTTLPVEAELIGFGLHYDISMWLADLTAEEVKDLYDRNSRRYLSRQHTARFLPYEWRDWQIDLFGSCFKVRKKGTKRWHVIWDVLKMHQRSFVGVLEAWLPDCPTDVHDLIIEEKARRGGDEKDLGTQTAYSFSECWTLAEIHGRFRQVLWDHGIKPKSWHGASIAKAMLAMHHVRDHLPERTRVMHDDGGSHWEYPEGEPVLGVLDRKMYVGGRFEISAHGPIDRPVYGYDRTSAYPDECRRLPSFRDHTWEHSRSRNHTLKHEGWFGALISWEGPPDLIWSPFPHKTGIELTFPRSIYKEWRWSPEVRVAAKYFPQYLTIHEAYLLHPGCDELPLSYMEAFFELRRMLDVEWKGKGDPIKVGLNSTYGALAEQSTDTPEWQCLPWAGMITSGTRARILEAIYSGDPMETIGVATDCIYSLVPRPDLLDGQPKHLGGWEESTDPSGCMFVQSGITLPNNPDEGKLKSRGIPARNLAAALPLFKDTWERDGMAGIVPVKVHHFYGGKIAALRPELRNTWCDEVRKIAFRPEPKRRDPFTHDGIVRSLPTHVGGPKGWREIIFPDEKFDELTQYELEKAISELQPDWGR